MYARAPSAYPRGDPLGYALELGLEALALQHDVHADWIPDAQTNLREVWIWDGWTQWQPDRWRRTWDRVLRRASSGIGVIVDAEGADEWAAAGRLEALALIDRVLAAAAGGIPMMVTTFQFWPWRQLLVDRVRELGGSAEVVLSPQLFTPASEKNRDEYLRAFRGGSDLQPVIGYGSAERWRRDGPAYREYVRRMVCTHRGPYALWPTAPVPDLEGPYAAAVRELLQLETLPGVV